MRWQDAVSYKRFYYKVVFRSTSKKLQMRKRHRKEIKMARIKKGQKYFPVEFQSGFYCSL
jgi:hypothetical protein